MTVMIMMMMVVVVRMDGWMDGWMGGWVDGWMDGRRDGWREGCRDAWKMTMETLRPRSIPPQAWVWTYIRLPIDDPLQALMTASARNCVSVPGIFLYS